MLKYTKLNWLDEERRLGKEGGEGREGEEGKRKKGVDLVREKRVE